MASLSERVRNTHEWRVFATQPPGPGREWTEGKLAERELLLVSGPAVVEFDAAAKADVIHAQDVGDKKYAARLMELIRLRPWCLGLSLFDKRYCWADDSRAKAPSTRTARGGYGIKNENGATIRGAS